MAQGPPSAASAGVTAEVLRHVPGCEHGEAPISISPLPGAGHRGVRVRTRSGEFAVRFKGHSGAALALDPRREALLHQLAAGAGLAPRVVWAAPTGEALITEHVAGRLWTLEDMSDARQLERLGERLRMLHVLPLPRLAPFDPIATATRYRAAGRATDAADAAQLDAWLEEVRTIVPLIASESRAAAIIHGDLHHTNVIEGETPVLIDFEYAALADPLLDLGCLLAYHPPARVHSRELLDAAGLATSANREMLFRAVELYERLSSLWARAVTAPSPYGARDAKSAD